MTYEEQVRALGDGLARVLEQVRGALERGQITPEDFRALAAQLVAAANAQGYVIGELGVRAYLEALTAEAAPIGAVPTPPPHVTDTGRLERALGTILASGQDTRTQLERLARNEPAEAAATGNGDAMRRESRVRGWTRGLEADACELCRWWWRNGRIWQPDHPMPRHTGCACHQVPVIGTINVQSERQARAAARRREGTPA